MESKREQSFARGMDVEHKIARCLSLSNLPYTVIKHSTDVLRHGTAFANKKKNQRRHVQNGENTRNKSYAGTADVSCNIV